MLQHLKHLKPMTSISNAMAASCKPGISWLMESRTTGLNNAGPTVACARVETEDELKLVARETAMIKQLD